MKARPILLFSTATLLLAGYFGSLLKEDNIKSASLRLGEAIAKSDTATIWTFVPDEERAYYGFDQKRFEKFWTTIVQPRIKGLNSFRLESAANNGLVVVMGSDDPKSTSQKFSLLVSGQLGKYFCPYIVGYAVVDVANSGYAILPAHRYQEFEHLASWVRTNKSELETVGISKLRRGAIYPSQTLDQVALQFDKIARDDRQRIKVASK